MAGLTRALPIIAAAAALLAVACAGDPSPGVGDHWHASYAINICGTDEPLLPPTDGGVHADENGVIHIQPLDPSEEGKGARLVQLFRGVGGDLGEDSLQLPGERPWQNRQRCPNGRDGRVVIIVNEDPLVEEIETYIPQDGDRILIAFVPVGSIRPSVPPPPIAAHH